jgi:signal transduction histidine kinase
MPGVGIASITLSLIAFNALFALQNGLDIAFLWSGVRLPEGMTLAEYAHRGAYPLIATALLAALFVLLTLQPGSQTAESSLIRRLVYAWIGQNLLLVASTILRTLDYVDAYSLTRLRIAALIWMALVAVGLVLICYRIWRSKSGAWLINANLAAALVALSICSVVDLGRMAAAWNVRHAREAGRTGANLDICYLRGLGASALLPMIELEGRTRNPILRERVGWARIAAMEALAQRQSDWRGWTVRGALRLSKARESAERRRLPSAYGGWRACDGPLPSEPLTAGKRR